MQQQVKSTIDATRIRTAIAKIGGFSSVSWASAFTGALISKDGIGRYTKSVGKIKTRSGFQSL